MKNIASMCLVLSVFCNPDHDFKIICDAICKRDGDKKGIVIDKVCGCWNPIDISEVVLKIPSNPVEVVKPKKYSWSTE